MPKNTKMVFGQEFDFHWKREFTSETKKKLWNKTSFVRVLHIFRHFRHLLGSRNPTDSGQMSIKEFGCVSGGLLTSTMGDVWNLAKSLTSDAAAASQQWCWPFTVTRSVQSQTRRWLTPDTVTMLSDRVTRFRWGTDADADIVGDETPVREFK